MATRAAREKSFTSIAHLLGIKLFRQPERHAVLGSLRADKRGLHPSKLHGQDFTSSLAAIHIIIIHVCYVFVTSRPLTQCRWLNADITILSLWI